MRGGSVPVVGRQAELGAIGSIIDDARSGFGGSLVIVGDPGVGKSTLLQSAASNVPPTMVRTVVGVETESAFGYAGLHRLLLGDLGRLDELTDRDRLVLSVALGLESGAAVGVRLVGLALLSLLSTIAGSSGVVVVVDDAQWLDTESLHSLAFAARRIRAEGVAVVFAVRPDSAGASLDGLDWLDVDGLSPDVAAELLRCSIETPVSEAMVARIVESTGGNPLALVDLGRVLSAMELSGAAVVHDPVPISERLERHYRDRLVPLDAGTRTWLLLAAVNSSAETTTVDLAARTLGLDPRSGDVAEAAQIVSIRSHVQFRHPLVRASVVSSAAADERRRVHAALAAVAEQRGEASRRALHLAAAATGIDELLADELERCSGEARARGAHGECAAFLTRAAELTGPPERRADRFVAAAASVFADGSLVQANALIERCESGRLAGDEAARLLLLRARIDARTGEPNTEPNAAVRCLEAAEIYGLGTVAGRAALLAAGEHAAMAAEFAITATVPEVARVIAGADAPDHPDPVLDGLLAGYLAIVEERWVDAVDHVRAAVGAMERGEGVTSPRDHTTLSTTLCSALWDWERMNGLLERAADSARANGDLSELDIVLYAQSLADTNLGNLALAEQRLVEGHRLRSTIGPVADDVTTLFRHPGLLAWTGADSDLAATAGAVIDASSFIGMGAMATLTRAALALDHLAWGEYEEACSSAVSALQGDPLGVNVWVAPIVVEAAARVGDLPLAISTVRGLSRRAEAAGNNWSLGVLARTVALADDSTEAEHAYRRSIALLTPTPARADLARSHLVYGEWLRRRRRRSDARTHLRSAHSMFVDMGAVPFAERSRIELAATGERVRDRTPAAAVVLTPQEDQVARLAADGMTNAEIASRLYISAKTVDYHLGKVYRKLGIDSRRQLRTAR